MNWTQLISDLLEVGLTQSKIAEELGKSQAWVSAIVRGRFSDMKWADGQALIALHARFVVNAAPEPYPSDCTKPCDGCPHEATCEERRQRERRALEKLIQHRREEDK